MSTFFIFFPKVCGFMDPQKGSVTQETESNEGSNHMEALRRFSDAGYEVRFVVTNPRNNGVPASRARIHYMGLHRDSFPEMNVKEAMNAFHELWENLNVSVNFNHTLDDFLLLNGDLTWTPPKHDLADFAEPPSKRQKVFKWHTLHEEFCRKNEVFSQQIVKFMLLE